MGGGTCSVLLRDNLDFVVMQRWEEMLSHPSEIKSEHEALLELS